MHIMQIILYLNQKKELERENYFFFQIKNLNIKFNP
jgi:hypothetical protein